MKIEDYEIGFVNRTDGPYAIIKRERDGMVIFEQKCENENEAVEKATAEWNKRKNNK